MNNLYYYTSRLAQNWRRTGAGLAQTGASLTDAAPVGKAAAAQGERTAFPYGLQQAQGLSGAAELAQSPTPSALLPVARSQEVIKQTGAALAQTGANVDFIGISCIPNFCGRGGDWQTRVHRFPKTTVWKGINQ